MARSEQLLILNEFEGRRQPSDELVKRAKAYQATQDVYDTNPVSVWASISNTRDSEKLSETESKARRALIVAKIMGRTTIAMTVMSPTIVTDIVTGNRFDRQLRKEYPNEFTVPSPNPEWSERPVLTQPAEQIASALLEHEAGIVASQDMAIAA